MTAIALAACPLLAGNSCHDTRANDPAPIALNVTGDWIGTWISADGVSGGQMRLSLDQTAMVGVTTSFDGLGDMEGLCLFGNWPVVGGTVGNLISASIANAVQITAVESFDGAIRGEFLVTGGPLWCQGNTGTIVLVRNVPGP